MAELTVIIPSRGRPHTVVKLAESFVATASGEPLLVFSLDEDDPTLGQYLSAIRDQPSWVDVTVAANANMGEALNRAASGADGFAVAFMGDDHRPRSRGWDAEYLNALHELGTGIVYGDDLLQRQNLPTQVAMTTDIVRALGWMTPPSLGHLAIDNWWLDLGRMAGCIRYLPDVVVEHMHPVAGKSAWTEGHVRVNSPEIYRRDLTEFARLRLTELPRAARIVRNLRGGV